MAVELDHLFVCSAVRAPEAELLIDAGLAEGTGNVHPGQGTANRRFFFANAMLELIWVDDPAETRSDAVARTGLWQRWSGRNQGACPFGVCFRPVQGSAGRPPFDTWQYRPPYLPPQLAIDVATSSRVSNEPFLFHVAFGMRPDQAPLERRQPIEHAAGVRELTRLHLAGPFATKRSPELEAALATGCLTLGSAAEYRMELEFDRAEQGRTVDFGPQLPLLMRW